MTDREAKAFYDSAAWARVRRQVLELDHYECQMCRVSGRLTHQSKGKGATLVVHHVKHLKDRPDLALCIYDPDTSERQLVTLCEGCHDLVHPEKLKHTKKEMITEEWW